MLRATTSTTIEANVFSCLGDEPVFVKDFPQMTSKVEFKASVYLHDEIQTDAGFDIPILFGGIIEHPKIKVQPVIYMNPNTGEERITNLWWFERPYEGYYGLICNEKPNIPKWDF